MFKSIQWKLVTMFVLLVVAVMIVVGTFLLKSVTNFYHNDFKNKMDHVFENKDFQSAITNTNSPVELENKLKSFIGRLGIDSYRNYFILDSVGAILATSANAELSEKFEYSDNIIAAMNGKKGTEVLHNRRYADYAWPILKDKETQYIIYIRDEKNDLRDMMEEIFRIILEAVLFGLIISIVLGFFLSNTITTPIANLTRKAEKLAAGDFDQTIEVKSKDEIGKLTNTFNFMASELKQTLEEIASEKNKVETILLYMTDGVIAFNVDGRIIHANPAAKRMLNIHETQDIVFDDFFKKIDVNISIGELIYLEHWKTVERQINMNDQHLKAFFATFKVEKEKVGGVIVVLQDVTEQEKLDMSRREFVANVSHELRTPLTSIKSYIETLLEGALEDKETAVHFLKVVNNESDRMTRLVKDLLILSRLDHKQTQWSKHYFSIVQLIEEVVEKLSLEAKSHKHTVTFTSTADIPQIYADKDRIEQVIKNIISNAIKYTPSGGQITITAQYIDNDVCISIKDNGIGIPKEDQPRIFERFYRVDKARSRELGGTGLGLAIAKEIITAHNGTIAIESELDQGTEVTVKLPVA